MADFGIQQSENKIVSKSSETMWPSESASLTVPMQQATYTKDNNWGHHFHNTRVSNFESKRLCFYACLITADLAFRLRKIALKLTKLRVRNFPSNF